MFCLLFNSYMISCSLTCPYLNACWKGENAMGIRRKFSSGMSSYYLYFSGCWRCNENRRSQNALLFLHHKEYAPWKHALQLHLFWNLFQVELYTSLPQKCTSCHPLQRLLNWCTSLVIIVNSTISVGRGGAMPLDFENFTIKGLFLSFEWENTNFLCYQVPPNWVWNGLELTITTFAVLSLVSAGWTELTSEIFCSNGFLQFAYQICFFFSWTA